MYVFTDASVTYDKKNKARFSSHAIIVLTGDLRIKKITTYIGDYSTSVEAERSTIVRAIKELGGGINLYTDSQGATKDEKLVTKAVNDYNTTITWIPRELNLLADEVCTYTRVKEVERLGDESIPKGLLTTRTKGNTIGESLNLKVDKLKRLLRDGEYINEAENWLDELEKQEEREQERRKKKEEARQRKELLKQEQDESKIKLTQNGIEEEIDKRGYRITNPGLNEIEECINNVIGKLKANEVNWMLKKYSSIVKGKKSINKFKNWLNQVEWCVTNSIYVREYLVMYYTVTEHERMEVIPTRDLMAKTVIF